MALDHASEFITCDSIKSYGVINKTVTLSPPHGSNFKEITWKKQKDKVIDWYDSKIKTFEPFKNRAYLDIVSGNLTISNLTSSDEDEYEFVSSDGNTTAMFSLTVLDPLPSPTLNCSSNDENIIVECMLPDFSRHVDLLVYSWTCSSEKCKREAKLKIIFEKEDDLSQEVWCIVKNPVSAMNSSIILRTCMPAGK
ncbi:PREDICTED: lymphocyte function-associated antigen 3 [Chrysochloris asiatica]|uniref:Lymphocyte function-associated antigen 3 n=1 Tax=Chrysochloris asiatica TaxID=185453 RepID=A0A9B0U338_CHRAS|nr:PREDICTED: lymphocyte function-associated antigen 3 [Chrysochloris asiatica]